MDMPASPALARRWVGVVLVLLAVPNLITGAWGVLAPRHWFDRFPGWAPRLVGAYPPFNEHLAADAAAGLLAIGVAAAIAWRWRDRRVVLASTATVLAFAAPHAVFHLTHPSDLLTGGEQATNDLALVAAVIGAAVVAMAAWRSPDDPTSP